MNKAVQGVFDLFHGTYTKYCVDRYKLIDKLREEGVKKWNAGTVLQKKKYIEMACALLERMLIGKSKSGIMTD